MFTTIYPLYLPGAKGLWVLNSSCVRGSAHMRKQISPKNIKVKKRDYRYIISTQLSITIQ